MSEITPGPWEWVYGKYGGLALLAKNVMNGYSKPYAVVEMTGSESEFDLEVEEGDRALIAAAPDLLEALEAVQWSGHSSYRGAICAQCGEAKDDGAEHSDDCPIGAAIAKARGGEA